MFKWRGLFVYLLVVGVVVTLHFGALRAVIGFWNQSLVYDHGALLTLFVILAVGSEVAQKSIFQRRPQLKTIFFVVLVGSLLVIASMATLMLGQMIFLPLLIWVSVSYIYGVEVARRFAFLFLALIFSWPVWDFLIAPLQTATVAATNLFLTSVGITAYVDGDEVFLRYGSFIVERGCAGLNFLLAGLTLGAIYAYWFMERLSDRVIVLIAAVMLSIAANWLRVILIVLAGEFSDMEHFLVEQHSSFGWLVFSVMILAVYPFGKLLESRKASVVAGAQSSPGRQSHDPGAKSVFRPAILMALLVIPPAVNAALERSAGPSAPIAIVLPESLGSWSRGSTGSRPEESPVFVNASSSEAAEYVSDARRVAVWVFSYDLRDRERELVGYPNSWYDRKEWGSEVALSSSWPSAESFFLPKAVRIENRSTARVLIGGYMIDDSIASSSLEAKVRGVLAFILGEYQTAAIVLSADCEEADCDNSVDALQDLAARIALYGRDQILLERKADD